MPAEVRDEQKHNKLASFFSLFSLGIFYAGFNLIKTLDEASYRNILWQGGKMGEYEARD